MKEIIRSFLRRLTNLSGNNRSLLLLRLNQNQYLDLHELDFILNEPSFQVIHDLVGSRKRVALSKVHDSRDADNNRVSMRLRKLHRFDNYIYEEQGVRDLYVGWPFVQGRFSEGTPVRCPLLFFPVQLEQREDSWYLSLRSDVNVTLNKTFLLAYYYYNQVSPDEDLIEHVIDDFDKDSRVFRNALYELFKNSNVDLHFNQELFIDKLQPFKEYKKEDFLSAEQDGKLKLYPEALLGIFPQSGSYLVPDYLSMLENEPAPDLEHFFGERSLEGENTQELSATAFLNRVKEEQTFTPFKMDAWQENVIKAVKEGHSLVVEGPPGTGKSQLICNLIADHIARGKRVLVVCQKRAALDVVYERLKKKGVADFIGLVHDFKNDRKDIYEQIASQIERLHEYKQKNNSLDSIQLERSFLQASRRIDQISEELEEFKEALYNEEECGLTVKELYLSSDPHLLSVNLKQEYRHFHFGDNGAVERRFRSYLRYARRFQVPDYPWYDRRSFSSHGIQELKRLEELIGEIPAYQDFLLDQTRQLTGSELGFNLMENIESQRESVLELINLLDDEQVYNYFQHLSGYRDSETELLWLTNTERIIMDCFTGVGPEMSLAAKDLGRFQESLQRSMNARKNIIGWLRWSLFSKDKIFITRVMVANGLRNNKEGFRTLVDKVDNRLNLEHYLTKLKNTRWVHDLPQTLNKADFQTWFFYQKKALRAKLTFGKFRNFREYFDIHSIKYLDLRFRLEGLLDLSAEVPEKKAVWLSFLTLPQITHVLGDELQVQRMQESLRRDFEDLCEFDKLAESMPAHETSVIEKVIEALPEMEEEASVALFQNSIRLAWIDHIETKFPILRTVSSQKFRDLEAELQESVSAKLAASKDILLLKVREQTFRNAEYNRLNNLVTYRDLKHQVSKKRRIWPVRKTIAAYHEELFDLVPCWLVSPDAASAIFPMQQIFDLVIFDEASQCFSEKGLPAIYRGKKLVITGDSQQLRPSELYQVRWEDEEQEEQNPELQLESLLDLGKHHLMQLQLRSHYRSRSLDLIEFSNMLFYDGKLSLLPHFRDMNSNEPAIDYVKVDGVWKKNLNRNEAIEVLNILRKIYEKDPNKSVGIVTFNSNQQNLIAEVIEDAFAGKTMPGLDSLIIKNIENIQGDERDVIIFSTAYAKDENGRLAMQFGSLNQTYGENRLNVAVTRAREKIYLVTSIWPQDLHVEESKNPGPRMFKAYMEYALRISEGNYSPTLPQQETHHHDWFLSKQLPELWENSPLELKEELPFSDLVVKEGDQYLGLIFTDDNRYFQSLTMKDAHVYEPFSLEVKDWHFLRFYSREFWMDKAAVKDSLQRYLAELNRQAHP